MFKNLISLCKITFQDKDVLIQVTLSLYEIKDQAKTLAKVVITFVNI